MACVAARLKRTRRRTRRLSRVDNALMWTMHGPLLSSRHERVQLHHPARWGAAVSEGRCRRRKTPALHDCVARHPLPPWPAPVKACVTPALTRRCSRAFAVSGQVLHKPRGRKPRPTPRWPSSGDYGEWSALASRSSRTRCHIETTTTGASGLRSATLLLQRPAARHPGRRRASSEHRTQQST